MTRTPGATRKQGMGDLTRTVLLLLLVGIPVAILGRYIDPRPGSTSQITERTESALELEALRPLEQARAIGDHYGVEELTAQGKVVIVPAGINVLVLERFSAFGGNYFYRKVRLLSGDFAGMAVWVSVTALSGGGVTLGGIALVALCLLVVGLAGGGRRHFASPGPRARADRDEAPSWRDIFLSKPRW